MKDATKTEQPKTEKVKKEVQTQCLIKCMFKNYGMEKKLYDVITFKLTSQLVKLKEEKLEDDDRLLRYAYDLRYSMVRLFT